MYMEIFQISCAKITTGFEPIVKSAETNSYFLCVSRSEVHRLFVNEHRLIENHCVFLIGYVCR